MDILNKDTEVIDTNMYPIGSDSYVPVEGSYIFDGLISYILVRYEIVKEEYTVQYDDYTFKFIEFNCQDPFNFLIRSDNGIKLSSEFSSLINNNDTVHSSLVYHDLETLVPYKVLINSIISDLDLMCEHTNSNDIVVTDIFKLYTDTPNLDKLLYSTLAYLSISYLKEDPTDHEVYTYCREYIAYLLLFCGCEYKLAGIISTNDEISSYDTIDGCSDLLEFIKDIDVVRGRELVSALYGLLEELKCIDTGHSIQGIDIKTGILSVKQYEK